MYYPVNIATRAGGPSVTRKINISGSAYQLVKDDYNCTIRGKICAKGIGEIEMYFLEGRKVGT
jgi:class 3 adenylate cyclase